MGQWGRTHWLAKGLHYINQSITINHLIVNDPKGSEKGVQGAETTG